MDPVASSSGSTGQRHATSCRTFTGTALMVLLLFVAGVDSWRWGSESSCPPGPEPQCPENPVEDASNYFPHPTDCHYYIQCDSSRRPICRRCSPTTYFNPKTFNCVWPLQASCEHNETTRRESLLPPICGPDRECYGEGETERDYVECSRYYVCRNGTKVRMECPEGQAFNARQGICDEPENAGCDDFTYLEDRRCAEEGKPIKIDCHSYVICKHGKNETYRCNANQYFDEATRTCQPGSCDKPICEDKEDPTDCNYYFKDCNRRTKCPEDKHFNKKTKHCENQCTAGCKNPNEIPQCRQCQEESKILQFDCHSYTICKDGKIVSFNCRADQRFDELSGTCKAGSCKTFCEDREDPTDCNYYIKDCDQRTRCPDHQHFNRQTRRCENQCTAGCKDPKDIPQCRQCEEGQIQQYDCHSYNICKGGRIVNIICRTDQHFDSISGICKPGPCTPPTCEDKEDPTDCNYYIKNCNQRTRCPAGQHFNKLTKRCENQCTAGCQDPINIPQCRQCNEEGKILQYDCHSYATCTGGKVVSVKCRVDQYFDVTSGTCKVGSCNPEPCEDIEDPTDCNYYIKNCNQRTRCPVGQHFNKLTKRCENQCTAGCQDPINIPQCRQCNEEGKILQYDCHSYTTCTGGKVVSVKCRVDQYFDVTSGTCKVGSCNPEPCEDIEDPTDCNYYIKNCNQRTRCPVGQHFNKLTKRCENQCTAGCQDPINIPQCRQCNEEGKILQYDCHSYTTCTGGKVVSVKCRVDQYFDVTSGTCKVGSCNPEPCEDIEDPTDCNYYIKNCNQRTRCPVGQHFNKLTKRCENQCTAGCQDPINIPQCRQCNEEGKILQYDCHSYTTCTGGKVVSVKCRVDQYFDVTSGTCKVGSCNPEPCEDIEDPTDCNYYIKNCNQRTRCPVGQHFNKLTKRCENQCTAGCQDPINIPQCRQCNEEGKILQYDCHSYTTCKAGKIVPIMCRLDQYFDVTSGTCKVGSCNPEPCEDKEDPTDCNYYIKNCNQRTRCPAGQHFNKLTKRCENQCTAGCQDPINIPQCRQCNEEGKILQYDCHSYTTCKGGKIVSVKCRVDQYFDVTSGTCKVGSCNPEPCEDIEDPTDCNYYIKNCNQRTRCPVGQHFNKLTKRCENQCTAGCQDPINIPQCRQCNEEGKILQYDCHSYATCTGGKVVSVKCRVDQYFDVTSGTCKVGSCNPEPCEDIEDPTDCNYYIKNCNQRTRCPVGQHFNKLTKRCENQCTAGCQKPEDIPQCRLCQEGEILQYDCHSYTICEGGKLVPVTCRADQYFDVLSGTCKIGSCDPNPCEDVEDPADCNYYFTNCNQRKKCPQGQHFNRKTKRCENQCTAGCIDPSKISDCHLCEPEGKTFEDPCSCEMYYVCKGGVRVIAMCDDGLHYNRTLAQCDVPCSDTCPKLFARKPECCASTKGKPEPLCPSTTYSVFLPHPSDSRWFYQCQQGVLYCNRCPPGYKWNTDEDTCDKSCQCP
ncbi:proprotein convertase subtilisin/kexin type 5-like [Cryptotermes secundus]|uniref:proprotein convertase subtilisin/kexin type 5-like n=1 Tax=Cryptotermes secundus TaxID=105785 RepID=UPI000CD7D926|nr:proprotein convertase subtilisin/kexin type 5-like [Cryptotermes secundus]